MEDEIMQCENCGESGNENFEGDGEVIWCKNCKEIWQQINLGF